MLVSDGEDGGCSNPAAAREFKEIRLKRCLR
jgi:hypothetical protein